METSLKGARSKLWPLTTKIAYLKKGSVLFALPSQSSLHVPVNIGQLFTFWVRIHILHADPDHGDLSFCESGSETLSPICDYRGRGFGEWA